MRAEDRFLESTFGWLPMPGYAHKYIHGGGDGNDNIPAVRSFVDAEWLLEQNPNVDYEAVIEEVMKTEYTRVGSPRSPKQALRMLARRLHLERTKWFPGWLARFAASNADFKRAYKTVVLQCPECCSGHLRVLKRRYPSGRWYRFAACSDYHVTGCRFTVASKVYAVQKSLLIFSTTPLDYSDLPAYLSRTSVKERPSRAASREKRRVHAEQAKISIP